MGTKAFVLGGTGQIGSYMTEFLIGQSIPTTVMFRRNAAPHNHSQDRLFAVRNSPLLTKVPGDITDSFSLLKILDGFSPDDRLLVFNFAAQSFVGCSFTEPVHTMDVTGKGVTNLLEALRHSKLNCRLLQMSSSEQFGSQVDRDGYQRETTPMVPNSPYGAAKLYAHNMVDIYRRAYGMFAMNAITFNTESQRRGNEFVTKKIANYVRSLEIDDKEHLVNCDREKIKLGNINSMRDWTHAKDTIRALWLMINNDKPVDYVVSSMQSHTVATFFAECLKEWGLEPDIEKFMEKVNYNDRPLEVPFLCGDSTKIRQELGWEPQGSLKDIVSDMIWG